MDYQTCEARGVSETLYIGDVLYQKRSANTGAAPLAQDCQLDQLGLSCADDCEYCGEEARFDAEIGRDRIRTLSRMSYEEEEECRFLQSCRRHRPPMALDTFFKVRDSLAMADPESACGNSAPCFLDCIDLLSCVTPDEATWTEYHSRLVGGRRGQRRRWRRR